MSRPGPADRPDHSSERTRTVRELFTSPHAGLAIGVLLLEFSAGITVYVSAAVVPLVIADLNAAREYPLIVSATSVGLFTSLALTARLLRRIGPRPVLAAGLVTTVAGAVISAMAGSALVFAFGRLAAALGSGLLGVFGTAAVIAAVPQGYRIRLLALTSAMWILPGIVGPAAAVAVLHAIGWRWTLLLVLPLVLAARVLVGRAGLRATGRSAADGHAAPDGDGSPHGEDIDRDRRASRDDATDPGGEDLAEPAGRDGPPLWWSLLLPAGMAVFVFGSVGPLGSWSLVGLLVATVGAVALLPAGTLRLAAGPPRYLALLAVVSVGYFGADTLLTAIGTRADGLALMWVSVALGAAAVCWALASMVQPRISGSHGQHANRVMTAGVAVMATGAVAVVLLQATGAISGLTLLTAWCVAGAGIGLAYPTLYLRATTATGTQAWDAGTLATAVLVAESTGSVLGGAVGSAIVDGAQRLGLSEAAGLHSAMMMFAAVLVLAVGLGFCPGGGRARRLAPTTT